MGRTSRLDSLGHSWQGPVVARKHINGVTVGFIVGWRARWSGLVRNIRKDLIFKTVEEAKLFRSNMEEQRVSPVVEFEIIKD